MQNTTSPAQLIATSTISSTQMMANFESTTDIAKNVTTVFASAIKNTTEPMNYVSTTDLASTAESHTTTTVPISSVSTTDSASTVQSHTTTTVPISSVSTTDSALTTESSTMFISKVPFICTQSCPRGLMDIRVDMCRCCVIAFYDDYVEFKLEIVEMKSRYILTGSSDQTLAELIVLFDSRLVGLNIWIIETCESDFETFRKLV